MSWIFTSNKEFDDAVDKATSEMIPSAQEDMAMNLEITDKIRSKSVPPKDAMRALKRRLQHRNPNVQLLTLKLADVCVKNGGGHFLTEIASREFMDQMVALVNGSQVANEVRQKCLSLIQLWSGAFKGRDELRYVTDTYNSLKADGVSFPPVGDSSGYSSNMLDTTAAPDWTDSDVCERCRELFTLTKRKHHCRNCGKTYCNSCSSRTMSIPRLGISEEVRVCENCWLKAGGKSGPQQQSGGQDSTARKEIDAARKEEEDLQRAIALSMLESEGGKQKLPTKQVSFQQAIKDDSEDDPELAAAIAASLKETRVSSPPPQQINMYPRNVSPEKQAASYVPPARNAVQHESVPTSPTSANDLSASDSKNIELFSQLMEQIDATVTDPQQKLQQVQDLRAIYDQMVAIHPKIVRSIEECVEKHKSLMALHEKVTNGVRVFDRVQDEAHRAPQPQYQSYAPQQQYAPQPQYGQPQYGQPAAPYQPQPYYAPQQTYGQPAQQPAQQQSQSPQQKPPMDQKPLIDF